MRRLPNWLIVGAVGLLVTLAAADAIRPRGEQAARSTTTGREQPDLRGVLVVGGPDCSVAALRLPALVEQQPPRQPDCGGIVWSPDGTLNATCTDGFTDVALTGGPPLLHVRGCDPAWRADGSVSVIREGDLVVFRRHGRPTVFVQGRQLVEALAGEAPRAYEMADVAWLGRTRFAAILHGREPWQRAILVYSRDGVERFVPEAGQRISDLTVSPLGGYIAFARTALGREYVMLRRGGPEAPLPRVGNVRAIAWSPDERWVALATRTTTFIARTGTRTVVLRVPVGGESLDWLP